MLKHQYITAPKSAMYVLNGIARALRLPVVLVAANRSDIELEPYCLYFSLRGPFAISIVYSDNISDWLFSKDFWYSLGSWMK